MALAVSHGRGCHLVQIETTAIPGAQVCHQHEPSNHLRTPFDILYEGASYRRQGLVRSSLNAKKLGAAHQSLKKVIKTVSKPSDEDLGRVSLRRHLAAVAVTGGINRALRGKARFLPVGAACIGLWSPVHGKRRLDWSVPP